MQCVEDSEQKNDSINESMSDKGVYKSAPATPGLLIIWGSPVMVADPP